MGGLVQLVRSVAASAPAVPSGSVDGNGMAAGKILLMSSSTMVEMMGHVRSWTQPYEDPWRILPYGMAVLGTLFAAVVSILMAAHWRDLQWDAVLIVPSFFAVWLTLAWRFARTGLVVSDSGVRVRWLLSTRTFTWARVRRFYTARDILVRERLWMELADGTRVRTPIQRVRTVLFGSMLSDGGSWLTPRRYDALLRNLGHWLAGARSAAGRPIEAAERQQAG